jgi:hypothetical protein
MSDLDKPMDEVERVRCALAMSDAGYKWEPGIEDVAELLRQFDQRTDALREISGLYSGGYGYRAKEIATAALASHDRQEGSDNAR